MIVIVTPIPSKNHARIKPSITLNGKHICKTVIGGNPSPNKKSKRNPMIIKLRLLAIQRVIEARLFADNMILSLSIIVPMVRVHLHFGAEQKNDKWNELLYSSILSFSYFLN